MLIENIIIYGLVAVFLIGVFFIYFRKMRKESKIVGEKIEHAKKEGLYEPVSLHPVVDPNSCIRSGACVAACPEKDVFGDKEWCGNNYQCQQVHWPWGLFPCLPCSALSPFVLALKKRGVDLPHVNQSFETNVKGLFIAGEMGGMGDLLKNAVEQGKQAMENLAKSLNSKLNTDYDVIICWGWPSWYLSIFDCPKTPPQILDP